MDKVRGFDGLRGIAVILVILAHGEFWRLAGLEGTILARSMTAELGVTVFFVLSGFLITSLLIEEKKTTGSISLTGFYARRSLRIFPLYFLSISIMPALMYVGLLGVKGCTMLHAYTYTLNFAPKECVLASYSHFWSLAVEEHFYLVWPLAFLMGRRLALIFMWAVLFVCVLVLTVSFEFLHQFQQDYYVNRWTIPAAAPIAMGCIAAYYRNAPWMQSMFSRAGWLILIACAGVAILPSQRPYVYSVAMLGIVLFVYFRQNSILTRWLEWRPLAWVGTISYGLYVWQGVLGGNGPYRESPVFPPPLYEGLAWAFIASIASYYVFEKPIMKWKRHFSWRDPRSDGRASRSTPQSQVRGTTSPQ
ncbi:acyltransferase family protein [Achromobacter xylosoxidans]